jgi:hypothetical protein
VDPEAVGTLELDRFVAQLREFVEREYVFLAAVRAGEADLDAGRHFLHDQAEDRRPESRPRSHHPDAAKTALGVMVVWSARALCDVAGIYAHLARLTEKRWNLPLCDGLTRRHDSDDLIGEVLFDLSTFRTPAGMHPMARSNTRQQMCFK